MAVSVVSTISSTGASSTTFTINKPSGIAAGDLLVAVIAETEYALVAPTGWAFQFYTGGMCLWAKIATASEPASYTWTVSSARTWAVGITAFRGVNVGTPFGASSNSASGSGTSLICPSLTAAVGDMLVTVPDIGGGASPSATPPAGTTEQFDIAGSSFSGVVPWACMGTRPITSAGATGTTTWTLGSSSGYRNSATFLLNSGDPTASPITFTRFGDIKSAPVGWTVPASVSSLGCDVVAAAGYGGASAGKGGRVQTTMAVTPGEVLTIGVAYDHCKVSDIRQGGSALSNQQVVAGGGGDYGGHGGGLTGGAGVSGVHSCGTGYAPGGGGGGGTQSAGGAGGARGVNNLGNSNGGIGTRGAGAAGGSCQGSSGGGQGGDGYYGGGGGGGGDSDYSSGYSGSSGCADGSGSGGGGSSFTGSNCSSTTHTQGYGSNITGSIAITFTPVTSSPRNLGGGVGVSLPSSGAISIGVGDA